MILIVTYLTKISNLLKLYKWTGVTEIISLKNKYININNDKIIYEHDSS